MSIFKKQDLQLLEKAYSQVAEMNLGPAGIGLQPAGKPVVVTMGVPTAPANDGCEGEEERDSSEIEMAAADLHKIAEYAPKLQSIVSQMSNLEGWVAAKITKAGDYISSVYHWLEYQQHDDGNCSSTNMFSIGHETNTCDYAKQGCKCGQCNCCQ